MPTALLIIHKIIYAKKKIIIKNIVLYKLLNYIEGFIFANFASQTLAKISTSIHVYL